MKIKKTIIYLLFLVLLLLLFNSCVTEKEAYIPIANEELFGTWINTTYKPVSDEKRGNHFHTIKYNPDGSFEGYRTAGDLAPLTGNYTIVAKWTDSEDSVLYKLIVKCGDETSGYDRATLYELQKISNSGQTLEYMSSLNDYTTEIDPDHPEYHILSRQ